MAAIPVTITGVLADKYGRTLQNVTLFGEMVRSDVGIGGGPIFPPPGGGNGGNGPHPEHPIVIPEPPPTEPPSGTPPADKPPPATGGWGYVADWNAWGYFPGPTEAQPK